MENTASRSSGSPNSGSRGSGITQAPWFKVMITCCGVLLVIAACIEIYRRAEKYGVKVVESHPVDARIEITNPPAWLHRDIVSNLLDEAYHYASKDEAMYKRS